MAAQLRGERVRCAGRRRVGGERGHTRAGEGARVPAHAQCRGLGHAPYRSGRPARRSPAPGPSYREFHRRDGAGTAPRRRAHGPVGHCAMAAVRQGRVGGDRSSTPCAHCFRIRRSALNRGCTRVSKLIMEGVMGKGGSAIKDARPRISSSKPGSMRLAGVKPSVGPRKPGQPGSTSSNAARSRPAAPARRPVRVPARRPPPRPCTPFAISSLHASRCLVPTRQSLPRSPQAAATCLEPLA